MTPPDQLLRAQQLAYPGITSYMLGHTFDPFDPTKGDLAALNEALERAGWNFWYNGWNETYRAGGYAPLTGVEAKTNAERAMRCVEAMP